LQTDKSEPQRPDMNNNTFISQLRQQETLKSRSNGIIEAIDNEKKSLFNFEGILNSHYDKISRWELDRKINRLKECSTFIEWRNYDASWEIHNANFCRQPDVCPICAKRLQRNRVRRFKDPIVEAAKHFKYTYLLTMTVKNCNELRVALNDLCDGLQRFRRMGQTRSRNGRSPGEWGKVKAGFLSIEIKRGNSSGLWHPHAHALIFTNEKINYATDRKIFFNGSFVNGSKLSSDWNKATLGKSINIDCRPLFGRMINKNGQKKWRDVWSQALEILKYNTKLLDGEGRANAADLATILCVGYNRRKFLTYGAFRDVESRFYCGPLEPYISEPPQGFTGTPRIFTQRWNPKNKSYFGLHEHKVAQIPIFKKNEWRAVAGLIMGKFRKRKYRILGIRRWFEKRDRMEDFDKALENNEKLKLSHLKCAKEKFDESHMSGNELKRIFSKSYRKLQHFLTRQQFIDDWYKGVDQKDRH
jgi:hypothetical protein